MLKNFTIEQECGVLCEGVWYDLHNCYNVDRVAQSGPEFIITFSPDPIHGNGKPRLCLRCTSVDRLWLSSEAALETVDCLDRIGYAAADQKALDNLLTEEQADPSCHLVLEFKNYTIRVKGGGWEVTPITG